ncbi:GNAT family N-acetyltransferase [Candidatus Gracilibacteria bacterium]|nr:GNAT family N-acetyltransferase [Candidatus Gracilibacteria bacterium]
MGKYTVRLAQESDIDVIYSFIVSEPDHLKLRTKQEIFDILDSFFVAESQGEIIGCSSLEVYGPKLGEIRSLYVLPDFRRMGVQDELIQACVNYGKGRVLEILAITSKIFRFKNNGFDYFRDGEKEALFYSFRRTEFGKNSFGQNKINNNL